VEISTAGLPIEMKGEMSSEPPQAPEAPTAEPAEGLPKDAPVEPSIAVPEDTADASPKPFRPASLEYLMEVPAES
jgi:hypothetical protein